MATAGRGPQGQPETCSELDSLSVERRAVAASLLLPARPNATEERQRRIVTINAVTALCHRQEPRDVGGHHMGDKPSANIPSVASIVVLSAEYPLRCKPTQCIFCLGLLEQSTEN